MLKPVNRYISVNLDSRNEEQKSLVVLPDSYKPEQEKHSVVSVVEAADDIKLNLPMGSKIIVDSSMIDEIVINNTTYNVILENYVVGVLTPE
jgi:co-chaperonin GroES (HSP10)